MDPSTLRGFIVGIILTSIITITSSRNTDLNALKHNYMKVENERKPRCPLRCHCTKNPDNSTELVVTCDSNILWSSLPKLPKDSVHLEMTNCIIPTLRQRVSGNAGLRTLRAADFSEGTVSSVDSTALQDMTNLETLHLSFNNIIALPHETFKKFLNLQELHLDNNQFAVIPHENICFLLKLQILDMKSNKLDSVTFHDCFTRLTELKSLDISNNPVKQLEASDFYNLRYSLMYDLHLNKLELTTLKNDIFQFFPHLKILNIQSNNFTQLQADVFQYVADLTILGLQDNKFETISNASISNLSCLEILNFDSNKLTKLSLGSEFLNITQFSQLVLFDNNFPSLKNFSFFSLRNSEHFSQLNLESCRIVSIHADAFFGLKYLNTISLAKNPLDAAAAQAALFGLRFAEKLTNISFSSTNLKDFNNKTLQYLTNTSIQFFWAENSQINTIPGGSFKYLTNLRSIYLKDNHIKEIADDAFLNLNKLIYVEVSKNNLVSAPKAKYHNLGHLKVLTLTLNNIGSTLQKETFCGFQNLEELNLQLNNINKLTEKVFIYLGNLRFLFLLQNQIQALSKDVFLGLNKLERLDLNTNNLATIDADVFSQTPSLNYLDLSFNSNFASDIRGDIADLFKPLQKLTNLFLRGTGLQDLSTDSLQTVQQLSIVSLKSNDFSNWDVDMFKYQKNLTIVNFRNNKLASVSQDVIQQIPYLEELDVSNNMFMCDCQIQWFTNWIRTGVVYLPNLDNVVCKGPSNMIGIKLVDLFLDEQCMSLTFYYIYWSILIIIASLVTISTVIYRYRWYLIYWRHLVRSRKAMEREMGEERYVFDAFVSYTHQDQKWVIKEFLQKVEYEAKIRLCLHQRNWLAGRSIARNIIDSIEKSRKTVIILSNAFARSYWCELELSMAQHKLLTYHRDVVVPILLEPVQKKYVTEQMVCLFATQTYIKWPQRDERKQRRFWKRLIKTLRPITDQPQYDEDNSNFLTTEINRIRPAVLQL